MITKVGLLLEKSNNLHKQNNSKQKLADNPQKNINLDNIPYYVPFMAKQNSQKMSKYDVLYYYTDTLAKNKIAALQKEAFDSGYPEITTLHVLKQDLLEVKKYIDDLNNEKVDFIPDEQPPMGKCISDLFHSEAISKKSNRDKIAPVIDEYIVIVSGILQDLKPPKQTAKSPSSIKFSQDLTDSIWGLRKAENEPVFSWLITNGAIISDDEVTTSIMDDFEFNVSTALMIKDEPLEKRLPYSEYEDKAKALLKNLSLGSNMFLTFDFAKEIPTAFLDTLHKVNAEQGDGKTIILELNGLAHDKFLGDLMLKCQKDKENKYIVMFPPSALFVNSSDSTNLSGGKYSVEVPPGLATNILNRPKNIRFLLYDSKNNYYSLTSSLSLLGDFNEMGIPSLSTAQMQKYFKENPNLMKEIKIPFSEKAIAKAVSASTQLDGPFPTKTINLIKKIESYFVDNEKITEKDVAEFINEAKDLFKKTNENSSVEVIFDTGKTLDDIVGKASTKKEAMSLVRQIKSNVMGTKGALIYSQDGTPGSGRRFTAKAIAGEAGVPYVEMNTMDFGTKDVDLFGGGTLSPEASMKKLFSLVATQAEANPNKSAVLFIENFEYFSVGELVSIYHQKAMAQLLREMDKADKAGLNILVVGSVASPELMGEAGMKSFKFVDKIEVSSPGYNKLDRKDALMHVLNEENLVLPEDKKDNLLSYITDITKDFSYIDLKNFVKKIMAIAGERGHKTLTKADITEAFLQITTGRPGGIMPREHERKLTASHECGHATNLQVMNNIAKTLGKPWHISDKVNFITLDPRGLYGGAVYHGEDINHETSFENVFAELICAFGGNSAEKKFFGMDGSWGIYSDMQASRHMAKLMVTKMGMGARTGNMFINDGENLSNKTKELIEEDQRVIINNAKLTSELITDIYSDFNIWFTEKYASLVGTGDCIIDGDEFRNALSEWRNSQSPEKQRELDLCDRTILKIIEATKKGIAIRKEN